MTCVCNNIILLVEEIIVLLYVICYLLSVISCILVVQYAVDVHDHDLQHRLASRMPTTHPPIHIHSCHLFQNSFFFVLVLVRLEHIVGRRWKQYNAIQYSTVQYSAVQYCGQMQFNSSAPSSAYSHCLSVFTVHSITAS